MDGRKDGKGESSVEDCQAGNGMVCGMKEIEEAYSCFTDEELTYLYRRVRMAQFLRDGKKLMENAG